MLDNLPLMGSFKPLKTNNSNVWGFLREYDGVKVITIFNRTNRKQLDVTTNISKISADEMIFPVRIDTIPTIEKSKIKSDYKPYEIQVMVWQPKKAETKD